MNNIHLIVIRGITISTNIIMMYILYPSLCIAYFGNNRWLTLINVDITISADCFAFSECKEDKKEDLAINL